MKRDKISIDSFLKEKKISFIKKEREIVLTVEEGCSFNDFECIQFNDFIEGTKILEAKFTPEKPWITLSLEFKSETELNVFKLKSVREKEFDLNEFK